LPATIAGYHTKVVTFALVGQESGFFVGQTM